jgi:hypothetical protein
MSVQARANPGFGAYKKLIGGSEDIFSWKLALEN